MEARRLWAGLHLLDRQLVDRDGRMAGMVDDLELDYSEDKGQLYVVSILSGPGALANRFSRDIGNHITLAADADEVGTASAERWFRDHVIAHIPGSEHAAE